MQVTVSGMPSVVLPPPTQKENGTSPATTFLDTIARFAVKAILSAEKEVEDTASLPTVAAKKFIESFSDASGKELGKELVQGFSELIKSGFKTSSDKDTSKDTQNMSMIIIQQFANMRMVNILSEAHFCGRAS